MGRASICQTAGRHAYTIRQPEQKGYVWKRFWFDAESALHALVQLLCNDYTSLIAVLVQLLADMVKYVRLEATYGQSL